jgi:hypothetical protein
MQQKTINKMHLCLQEMHYVKEILDEKCADNQLAHLLSIYAAMRMSDFVLMLPVYNQTRNSKKAYIEAYSQDFQDKFLAVRNKLGAHFQKMVEVEQNNELNDLSERNKLFQSIDYETTVRLINDAELIFQIATEQYDEEVQFDKLTVLDKQTIVAACQRLYKDNGARLYNDILNVSRTNGISVLMCSKPQRKVQHVITLQMFIEDIRYLYDKEYESAAVKRMFKRMLVSHVMNFYDNLVTKATDPNLPQAEKALDEHLNDLFSNEKTADAKQKVQSLFDHMKSLPDADKVVSEAWDIRNFSCSHLDNTVDAPDLDERIDSYDINPLLLLYDKWVDTFKQIMNTHIMLSPLNQPLNQVIYDVQIEGTGAKSFYGDKVEIDYSQYMTSSITIEDAIAIIEKGEGADKYGLATEKIHNLFFDAKGKDYTTLKTILKAKCQKGMSDSEWYFYMHQLYWAKQGFPDKNQMLLLDLWEIIKKRPQNYHKYILTPIYANAEFDEKGKLAALIDELRNSCFLFERVYGGLILLRAIISRTINPYRYLQNPAFDAEIEKYIDGVGDEFWQFITVLSMAAFWFTDDCFHQKPWVEYDHTFDNLLMAHFQRYAASIDLSGEDGMTELTGCLQKHRFMEFTWCMMNVLNGSDERKAYEELVYQFLLGKPLDVLEEGYWALCVEQIGGIETARQMLWKLMTEHSNDPGLAITYCNFLGRHEEYRTEWGEQKTRINNEFVLTEEQKGWIKE